MFRVDDRRNKYGRNTDYTYFVCNVLHSIQSNVIGIWIVYLVSCDARIVLVYPCVVYRKTDYKNMTFFFLSYFHSSKSSFQLLVFSYRRMLARIFKRCFKETKQPPQPPPPKKQKTLEDTLFIKQARSIDFQARLIANDIDGALICEFTDNPMDHSTSLDAVKNPVRLWAEMKMKPNPGGVTTTLEEFETHKRKLNCVLSLLLIHQPYRRINEIDSDGYRAVDVANKQALLLLFELNHKNKGSVVDLSPNVRNPLIRFVSVFFFTGERFVKEYLDRLPELFDRTSDVQSQTLLAFSCEFASIDVLKKTRDDFAKVVDYLLGFTHWVNPAHRSVVKIYLICTPTIQARLRSADSIRQHLATDIHDVIQHSYDFPIQLIQLIIGYIFGDLTPLLIVLHSLVEEKPTK